MAKKQGKVGEAKSETVRALPGACSDETKAVEFMEKTRWNGEVDCPHCGVIGDAYAMRGRDGKRNARFLWRCRSCGQQFTVRVGTVFEDSRIPLRNWCFAFWKASSSKKGVSALQISRETGLSYKSALFMMHRIRFAMADAPGNATPLTGLVEADETYVGGKPRTRDRKNWKTWHAKKACVLGMLERGGRLRPIHVTRDDGKRIKDLVMENVSKGATLLTDESYLYHRLGEHFEGGHEVVNHSSRQYVRPGDIHTNSIEGFFAIFKRGLNGTFHSVSKKHLHRYLSEFEFRHSLRHVDDGERTVMAIRKAVSKRLTYREQIGGTA